MDNFTLIFQSICYILEKLHPNYTQKNMFKTQNKYKIILQI